MSKYLCCDSDKNIVFATNELPEITVVNESPAINDVGGEVKCTAHWGTNFSSVEEELLRQAEKNGLSGAWRSVCWKTEIGYGCASTIAEYKIKEN